MGKIGRFSNPEHTIGDTYFCPTVGKDHIVLQAVQREQKSHLCHGDLIVLSPLTDCASVAPLV